MSRILITGVAGETGSYLAERLVSEGHTVIGVDNFFNSTIDNLSNIIDKANFIFNEVSILDHQRMIDIFEKHTPTYIYHMAAIVETKHFYDSVLDTYEVNVEGTYFMYNLARTYGIKRFLNASTSEMFGQAEVFPTPIDHRSQFSSTTSSPRFSYAMGKGLGEYLGKAIAESEDLEVISLRYANLYGPRDIKSNHLIPHVARSLFNHGEVTLTSGSDTRLRSFLHVQDCVDATIAVMENGKSGHIYSAGSDEEFTVLEVATMIAETIGEGLSNDVKFIIGTEERTGDPERRLLDTSKTTEDTGWYPKIKLKEGLIEIIELIDKETSQCFLSL